jgi:hypothetical protein
MSFLTPWALGLAILAALPVALHLFRRDSRRRLAFPAIRYLRRARDRSARALKLRDRLLLIARVALVMVLAAAAAAPLVGRGDVADHIPTDVVLLVDNTGSMNRISGEATLLDRQRSRALELLRAARSGDRFWVLPVVGSVLASGVPATDAAEAIARVEATDATVDLGAMLREALRTLPPASGRPREVVLLSDLQASSLTGPPFELPGDTRLVASLIDVSSANTAVVEVRPVPPGPGGEGAVFVVLASSDPTTDTLEVRLSVSGQTVSIVRAESGGAAVFRLQDPGAGERAISVEIPASGLRSDDRRHFILRTLDPPVIEHIGPPDSYVARALETLDRAGQVSLVNPGRDAGADAWFVEGVSPAGLPVTPGAAWILTPPRDDELLARFNAELSRRGVPWKVDVVDVPGSTLLAPSDDLPGIEAIRVRGRHRLRSTGVEADTVLVEAVDESPWIVAGQVAGQRYVLIGSPLAPESTELPVTAVMLPLMEAVLFRWAGLGGSLPAPVSAGSMWTVPAGADSVAAPGGSRVRVDGGSPYIPLRAGIHTVYMGDGSTSLLAATVPAAESDLRPASASDLGRALGSTDVVEARSEAEWNASMYGSRRGWLVSPYLLAVALALVLLEAALATHGRRLTRSERTPASGNRS